MTDAWCLMRLPTYFLYIPHITCTMYSTNMGIDDGILYVTFSIAQEIKDHTDKLWVCLDTESDEQSYPFLMYDVFLLR